jgi:hypothetical protein
MKKDERSFAAWVDFKDGWVVSEDESPNQDLEFG